MEIRLILFLAPVRWTQSVQHMLAAGMTEFVECGLGQVLTVLGRKMSYAGEVI